MPEGYETFKVTLIRSSAKAVRVKRDDGEEFWVPNSIIHEDSDIYVGTEYTEGSLIVPEWFAEKEGLV